MISNITFPARILKAIALFAAKTDRRYYLNGVHLALDANGATFTATNGHMLAGYRHTWTEAELPDISGITVIVPRELIDRIKLKKGVESLTMDVEHDDGGVTMLHIGYAGTTYGAAPVEGQYPDFKRIVKDAASPSGELAQFDPAYLMTFKEYGRIIGGKGRDAKVLVTVAHNGNGPALVAVDGASNDFYGLLMPVRTQPEQTPSLPSWIHPDLKATEATS